MDRLHAQSTSVNWCNQSQSAGSFDDMQDVHTGHKTDKGVVRKYMYGVKKIVLVVVICT